MLCNLGCPLFLLTLAALTLHGSDAKLRLSPSGKPVDITINTGDLLKWYKATYEALVEELSSSAE
jgi:hypothetical protein